MIEGNKFDAVRAAVVEAAALNRAVDAQAADMARLLRGRLRTVSNNIGGATVLQDLKRELRDFNANTGKWK